ncbi:hypothetical protein GCM10010123_43480 [Pilimelia anulata]|uniref:Uncharacterized protein n=1 Tax=Pilimelia anulata TaxID=53371 RepID=A0A8J3FEL7_9ACTN|nr:hypothetical protein [Pilimelia anulata]GGK08931.1 hypothetical protein GCM10010123_43480 [Pilimelia anulata]
MRFCYHVQSNGSAEHLTRLVTVVKRYSPGCVVHVSRDIHAEPVDAAALRALPGVGLAHHLGGVGDFSAVDRYLSGIDWVEQHAGPVDWYVNLRDDEYPIRPLRHAEDEWVAAGVDAAFTHWEPGAGAPWSRYRTRSHYLTRHRRLAGPGRGAALVRRPLRWLNRLHPPVQLHAEYGLTLGTPVRPPADLRLYGGEFAAALSWRAALHVRDVLRDRPDVAGYFRGCLAPERAVLPTLVRGGGFAVLNDSKRFVLPPGAADPVALAVASGAHFAGPLDSGRDAATLDRLDAHLAQLAD